MPIVASRIVALFLLLIALAGGALAQESDYSVQFKIEQTSSTASQSEWLATYERNGTTAKFVIAMTSPSASATQLSFTKGVIRHVVGSQPQHFLERLSLALGGKGKVPFTKRVDRLTFEVAVLGTKQTRVSSDGGFTSKAAGDWITMKIFLAQGEGEVYLNLNPAKGIGEFSTKDEEYAEVVLRELGSVL